MISAVRTLGQPLECSRGLLAIDFEDGVLGAYCTFTCKPSRRSHQPPRNFAFILYASVWNSVVFLCHVFVLRVNVRLAWFSVNAGILELIFHSIIIIVVVVIGFDNLTYPCYYHHVFPISVKRQNHTQTSDDRS